MSTGPSSATRKRVWPETQQFNDAVQNLASSMSDPELQRGQPELNHSGLPMPYAGGFADVYKVYCPETDNTWAVKFFKREVPSLRDRYREISDKLSISQLPFTVDFRYLNDGVRIGGSWYPIVKMKWVDGLSLNRFVAQSLRQPKVLGALFNLWVKLATRLRTAEIAHADLQHGNVLLVPDEKGQLLLKLIDYDGMYVPALAGRGSSELGHVNFQHPQRVNSQAFGPELDRFSHLAICCALRCLKEAGLPLWERFNNDDNLLFTSQDFAAPSNSALFRELWTLRNPDAHALVGQLALATQRPLEESPLVEELICDRHVRALTAQEQKAAQSLIHPARPTANSNRRVTVDHEQDRSAEPKSETFAVSAKPPPPNLQVVESGVGRAAVVGHKSKRAAIWALTAFAALRVWARGIPTLSWALVSAMFHFTVVLIIALMPRDKPPKPVELPAIREPVPQKPVLPKEPSELTPVTEPVLKPSPL